MKFKDLSVKDKQHIYDVYHKKDDGPWEKRASKLGEHFGVSERTIRKWCAEKLGFKEKEDSEPEQYIKAKENNIIRKRNVLLLHGRKTTPQYIRDCCETWKLMLSILMLKFL